MRAVWIDMVEEGKALADKPHIVISTPGRLADHINTGTNFSLKKLRFLVTVLHSIFYASAQHSLAGGILFLSCWSWCQWWMIRVLMNVLPQNIHQNSNHPSLTSPCCQLPHQTLHRHLYTRTHKLASATRHRANEFLSKIKITINWDQFS